MSSRSVLTIYGYIEIEDSCELDNIELISYILDDLNLIIKNKDNS